MGLLDIFKSKKANYKELLIGELNEIKSQYPTIPFYGTVLDFINKHDDNEWNSYFTKNPQKSPRVYLASMLSNVISDYLESGQFHIYRGVLNPDGENMMKLLINLLDIQKNSGEINAASVQKYLSDLRNNIANVG